VREQPWSNARVKIVGMLSAILSNEVVIHRGPASVWRSVEPVTGTLTLTRERLVFTPNAFLIRGGAIDISLSAIAKIEAASAMLLFPNRVDVVMRTGRVHKFVVRDRDEWIARIRNAKGST
jgi:hypothetical protein